MLYTTAFIAVGSFAVGMSAGLLLAQHKYESLRAHLGVKPSRTWDKFPATTYITLNGKPLSPAESRFVEEHERLHECYHSRRASAEAFLRDAVR
jgi:hypothetical protein